MKKHSFTAPNRQLIPVALSKKLLFILFCLLASGVLIPAHAQDGIGGNRAFSFLNQPASPRAAALGGRAIHLIGEDIGFFFQNPASLSRALDGRIGFNSGLMGAGIVQSNLSYARHYQNLETTFGLNLHYLSYGTFARADIYGVEQGSFQAGDMALTLGAGRNWEKYHYGANLKLVWSQLEEFTSLGAALDLAGSWNDTARMMTASLVIRNIGVQAIPYVKGQRAALPFDIQLAFSKRMAKAPFRLTLVAHNLQRYNTRYDDPAENRSRNLLGSDSTDAKPPRHTFDKIARHFIINTEVYFGKSFSIQAGYNHQQRQELSNLDKNGLTGFSMGFGIHIKQFQFNYAYSRVALARGYNWLGIQTDLHRFLNKKRTTPADPLD